jgi:hypothetical protein
MRQIPTMASGRLIRQAMWTCNMKNDGSGPKAYTTPTTAPARCERRSVQPAHQAAAKLPTTPRYKATFNTVVGEAPNHLHRQRRHRRRDAGVGVGERVGRGVEDVGVEQRVARGQRVLHPVDVPRLELGIALVEQPAAAAQHQRAPHDQRQ